MKSSWAQPSLSRDFALLSAAILFILFLISAWVTYTTYIRHSERIGTELEKEALRVERTLEIEMDNANYLLSGMGKQIILDSDRNLVKMAQVLKSFDSRNYIYTIFSWINTDQQVVVSSNKGVLDKPVDISDRDYVKKAFADPWKMTIGRPIEGRVSGRWVIPVAMGLTDYTGKFIGTLMISIDINTLTEQITNIVKRDGISFAIVSKTLIPLTQVADDKNFVNNNFPTEKLANVNFNRNPSGLVGQGSLFWGTGNYAFYKVSQDYPYIILLGYDTRYSDETMRSLLWSRLLQMMVMAVFFVLFLWIVRTRMIRPVLEMSRVVGDVANGKSYTALPAGGPVEIEYLSSQIGRVAEYIVEIRRRGDELRNKMLMFKKAKERAEIEKRSKSEFLAYVCNEMHTPLNNIVGFAQVMRDQLYGPIENRKYRQYVTDIYAAGTSLLSNMQDMLTLAKAETNYIELSEKPVDMTGVINRALRFVTDKMQAEKLSVKVTMSDPMPRLIADEFRMQQIFMNLMLYALNYMLPGGVLFFEAKVVNENKEKLFFAVTISNSERSGQGQAELSALAENMLRNNAGMPLAPGEDPLNKDVDLSLELARILIDLHNGLLDVHHRDGTVNITILFSGNRIRFMDN